MGICMWGTGYSGNERAEKLRWGDSEAVRNEQHQGRLLERQREKGLPGKAGVITHHPGPLEEAQLLLGDAT